MPTYSWESTCHMHLEITVHLSPLREPEVLCKKEMKTKTNMQTTCSNTHTHTHPSKKSWETHLIQEYKEIIVQLLAYH